MELNPTSQYVLDTILKRIGHLEKKIDKLTPSNVKVKCQIIPNDPIEKLVPPVPVSELPKPEEVSMMIKTRLGGL